MLLQLVPKLLEGEQWLYEVKWDDARGIAVIQDGEARLWSRMSATWESASRESSKRFAPFQ